MKCILLLSIVTLAAAATCPRSPPDGRDYTWLHYHEFNGFAYKNTQIVDSIFKTLKTVTLKKCFQVCVDTRTAPNNCLTFAFEEATKKCSLSNRTVPYDPTDPVEMKTAQRWCRKKGFASGWTTFMYD